jgi:hypothetical protein
MARFQASLVVLALAATAAACSTTEYIISTREGGTIISSGKPELDDAAGVYTYTDPNGRTSTVRKTDVLLVTAR